MLPLSILESTDQSILFELPAGKPNLKQKPVEGQIQERVLQSALKGNTCWYYTMNFIRKRIGKVYAENQAEDRRVELLCSLRRKAQTSHENTLPSIADQLQNKEAIQLLTNIDLKKAQHFIANKKKIQPLLETAETLDDSPSLFPFLEEFVKEGKSKNMYDFLVLKKFNARNEINMKFLASFGVSAEELFKSEITKANGYGKICWETLDILERLPLLDCFVRMISAKAYGLLKSSWKPLKGIDHLIQELKTKGPLFIGGAFGTPMYIDKPFKMSQTIAGRDIYAWRPGASRHQTIFTAHSVLLVGAKKTEDKAFVFFIDSTDPSDPKDKSTQKIYMISFTNLTSNICDLHGRLTQNSSLAYAYSGNFEV